MRAAFRFARIASGLINTHLQVGGPQQFSDPNPLLEFPRGSVQIREAGGAGVVHGYTHLKVGVNEN
jgi:hypothetical protein